MVGNRALQQEIWAVRDAQDAAKAADELRQAWASVGEGIRTEIERIRGLAGSDTSGGFAVLMSRFNAASDAARGGDQDAAKSLPQLSQALITAAGQVATSRQELDRVQAETAASLEATYAAISRMSASPSAASAADQVAAAATTAQAAGSSSTASDPIVAAVQQLKDEMAAMRAENTAGLADTASGVRRVAKKLDDVTDAGGGDAISVLAVA